MAGIIRINILCKVCQNPCNQPLSFITTPNYRPDRLPPVQLSSRVIQPILYKYKYKCDLYKCALFYCTLSHLSAFKSYVYSYNSYPVSPLNWTDYIKTNLSAAFSYCTSVFFSASDSYINLYNSYPAPTLDLTNLSTLHNIAFFLLYTLFSFSISRLRILI